MNTAPRSGLMINPDPARERTWSEHGTQTTRKATPAYRIKTGNSQVNLGGAGGTRTRDRWIMSPASAVPIGAGR
ncbi:MAG: hypothetical protein JWL97_3774 [Gemmatimonadales bacterium]|nr:hypothetical protein [Gemmatimonadales bacterium]